MLDAMRAFAPVALERSRVLERLGLAPGGYLVATLHRAENTAAERLGRAARGARGRSARAARPVDPAAAPAHGARDARRRPRPAAGRRHCGAIEPLGYLDMIALVARRAHRADGFRRPAEGGVLPRQALRDAARGDGMGRDGHAAAATWSPGPTRRGSAPRSRPGTRRSRAPSRTSPRECSAPSATARRPRRSSRKSCEFLEAGNRA